MNTYLLDANVFMAASRLHYGLDFCPAFWNWLIDRNDKQQVFSIQQVGTEVDAGQDDLADWASQRDDTFFLKPDSKTLPALAQVSQWVMEQNFEPAAINTFMQVADYFLVAQALAGSHILVTHEVQSNSVKRIKIPNVCIGVGVTYMTPFQMLRREKARFILGRGK